MLLNELFLKIKNNKGKTYLKTNLNPGDYLGIFVGVGFVCFFATIGLL